jgi:preprotein translocase subunit SecA
VKNVLTRLGMQEGEAIESKMVTRRVEAAQKKVEERNFEVRKNLLEYDEVMDEQRKRVYGFRQKILDQTDGESDCRDMILEMVDRQVDQNIGTFLDKDYGTQTFAAWASERLACELEAADYRGMTPEEAERLAVEEAVRQSEAMIYEAVEENLPASEDESEWNWAALASFANSRWKLSVNDRDLKRAGRDAVADVLQEKTREAIHRVDLSDGARFLAPDFGVRSACGWTEWRFGRPLTAAELAEADAAGHDTEAFKKIVKRKAREVYAEREAKYGDDMRRMERAVVLQILDNAWKDHLLAMDHLRSSVGLRGYAQVDPKVEYKREGMRTFDLMWKAIDERVVDIVYRIEQVEDDEVKSTFRETAAIHAEAPSAAALSAPAEPQQTSAAESRAEAVNLEPIRNLGAKVGRNDPCPCGSGKKFKNCCAKSSGVAAG